MPGIPQVWYLDLFAGKNDYEAADKGGSAGHKEINRTTLSLKEIEERLKLDVVKKQLEIIRLRNTSKAFLGNFKIGSSTHEFINMSWRYMNQSDIRRQPSSPLIHLFTIDAPPSAVFIFKTYIFLVSVSGETIFYTSPS